MSEDGPGTPAIGTMRMVGDDVFTFDGTDWRPVVALPSRIDRTRIRTGKRKSRPVGAAGEPDRQEQHDPVASEDADQP